MRRPSKDKAIGNYFEGISNEDYHRDLDFVSSSQLKEAYKSPENFRWYMHFKKEEEKKWEKGNSMDFGSLVHALLLEPETVSKEFAFMDTTGRNFRTNADKQYRNTFLDMHKNKIVLTIEDKERAELVAEMLMEHPFIREIMESPGENERSGYFYDDFHKLHLRFRPDRRVYDLRGKGAIVDLKTTANIEDFVNVAKYRFDYDLSAHMYLEGHKAITGEELDFYFMVAESQAPYRVGMFKATDRFLTKGREKYQQALTNVNMALNKSITTIMWQEADYQEI